MKKVHFDRKETEFRVANTPEAMFAAAGALALAALILALLDS